MVKIFWKKNCDACPLMKELGKTLQNKGYPVDYFDVGDVDGLTESAYYAITKTPTMILADQEEEEITRYEGFVPLLAQVEEDYPH